MDNNDMNNMNTNTNGTNDVPPQNQQNFSQQPNMNNVPPQGDPFSQQSPFMQPPVMNQPPMPSQPSKGMSIAALVLGILSIILFWVPYANYVILVLSILGVVFGAKGMKDNATGSGHGLAIAGLVLSIIGLCFCVVGVICSICSCAALCSAANSLPGFYY